MAELTMKLTDLTEVAQRYVDRWLPGRADVIDRLAAGKVRLDEDFCRRVADHFARQPRYAWSPALARRYALLREESVRQFESIVDAGVEIEPWTANGQPYHGARQLCDTVRATGVLHVYLTRYGHGPRPDTEPHPMRGPSGIVRSGVEFTYNDVFRAVHDVFGHVMLGHSMGPAGEFRATWCHFAMYSADVHPVLFSEQISQICWFFYGPHLRTASGRIPRRGEPDWVPPSRREYAEQKVFDCPQWFVDRFIASFSGVTQ